MIQIELQSAQATEALGARLAKVVPDRCIIYLQGDLGVGKTTLVRGFLRALGYTGIVRSPSYTLVEPYVVAGRQVIHVDLYRVADPDELEYIGLRDWLDEPVNLLVEWPERGCGMLPAMDINIELRYAGHTRLCRLETGSTAAEAILSQFNTEA